jgi:hypothetical protein
MNLFVCEPRGAYHEANVDVELSSDDDNVPTPKPNVTADQKVQAGDGTRDGGASSVEPTAHILIIPIIALSAGRRGRKCPPLATRRNRPIPQIDQVMTQVELLPYCGPRSALDLVAIEIIFGRIFEAFRQISQVATADDDKHKKKMRRLPLKKMLSQK